MVEESLIIFDVAGISTDIKENIFAQLDGWPTDKVPPPWDCYTPNEWDRFAWYSSCKEYAGLFQTAMHRPEAPKSDVQWWLGIILRHPVSYMKHRISYTLELLRNKEPIFNWGLPYAVNIPKNVDQISGAFSGGKDTGLLTHGIDMTQKIQMWEPTIAFVPFGWVAAGIFARPTSLVWGIFFCVSTLLWNWRNVRQRQNFDLVTVTSSAVGLGNIVMLAAFGVAAEGRYIAILLVCGIVSVLRTIGSEIQLHGFLPTLIGGRAFNRL
jgi:hypothetical protein